MLRRRAAKAALTLCGLGAGLVLAEVGLRVFGIGYQQGFVTDLERGWGLRPRLAWCNRTEGDAFVQFNSEGMRDVERSKPKPPHMLRIAVLGDSYTEAIQVPGDRTFCSVLERELMRCKALGGRQVEVMNFGVAGYGTAQELLTLRTRVWDYSPDVVIVAVYTGNDLEDNCRCLYQEPFRPYFVLRQGALVLDSSFRLSATYRRVSWSWTLLPHSRILQMIDKFRISYAKDFAPRGGSGNSCAGPQWKWLLTESPALYRDPSDPAWQQAWAVTEALLVQMRNEVRARGVDFWVVTLSNPLQDYPDPKVRQAVAERCRIRNLFYPDERIKAFGEREGLRVVNLAEPLQEYADQNRAYLHGFPNTRLGLGHWNAAAHHLAGQLIARELCERGKF